MSFLLLAHVSFLFSPLKKVFIVVLIVIIIVIAKIIHTGQRASNKIIKE